MQDNLELLNLLPPFPKSGIKLGVLSLLDKPSTNWVTSPEPVFYFIHVCSLMFIHEFALYETNCLVVDIGHISLKGKEYWPWYKAWIRELYDTGEPMQSSFHHPLTGNITRREGNRREGTLHWGHCPATFMLRLEFILKKKKKTILSYNPK